METQQHIENKEAIDKLLATNIELKKELEKEQLLHKMLYKEWKELSEKVAAGQQEAYENARPKNLFYKYAFYVLLVGLIPAVYFLYFDTGNERITPTVQNVSDSMPVNSSPAIAAVSANDSLAGKDSKTETKENQTPKQDVVQQPEDKTAEKTVEKIVEKPVQEQPAPQKPVMKVEEKVAVRQDASKSVPLIAHTPVNSDKPLTNDARDSLASEGFSAYFDHRRNPFRKSSEKYRAWQQGWNEGEAEAKKVLKENPSLKK